MSACHPQQTFVLAASPQRVHDAGMADEREPKFPILDEAPERGRDQVRGETIFGQPLEDWMVPFANHLAKREAEMPFRRRLTSFLTASNQAYSTKP